MFNTVVPPHEFAPALLFAIKWAQPLDSEKKYPELGRMRYAWLTEDGNIKILLKDGPNSWTEPEQREKIMKQIIGHETYVSHYTLERDPVYLVAEFKPVPDIITGEKVVDGRKVVEWCIEQDKSVAAALLDAGHRYHTLYEDPFDIFDVELAHLETNYEAKKLGESIVNQINKITNDDRGIEGTTGPGPEGSNETARQEEDGSSENA